MSPAVGLSPPPHVQFHRADQRTLCPAVLAFHRRGRHWRPGRRDAVPGARAESDSGHPRGRARARRRLRHRSLLRRLARALPARAGRRRRHQPDDPHQRPGESVGAVAGERQPGNPSVRVGYVRRRHVPRRHPAHRQSAPGALRAAPRLQAGRPALLLHLPARDLRRRAEPAAQGRAGDRDPAVLAHGLRRVPARCVSIRARPP